MKYRRNYSFSFHLYCAQMGQGIWMVFGRKNRFDNGIEWKISILPRKTLLWIFSTRPPIRTLTREDCRIEID